MSLTESDLPYTTTDSGIDRVIMPVERGEPTSFPLNGVIAGWTEGVQLMSPGAKYQFIIPHQLAYGEAGAMGVIPPKATLHFEIELLEFE